MHLVSLYFLSLRREDYRRGEVASVSTNRCYYRYLLPAGIVRRLLILSLFVEHLIKYSFSFPNYPKHKSLLVHIVGIPGQHLEFPDFLSQKIEV
jgi:hypothetical protein